MVDDEWAAPVEEQVLAVGADVDRGPDALEPQRSLFSWAEFLAEKPAEPRRRRRKPPASLPLFELAVSLEQEGQRELVGAEG